MRRAWLFASVALIVAATLVPFQKTTGELSDAHWCFWCSERWLSDAISNVALFVPLGVGLAASGRRASAASLVGLGLSVCIELLQWAGVPPGRSPSVLDLLTNTAGSLFGAALLYWRERLIQPSPKLATKLAGIWTMLIVGVLAFTSAAELPESGAAASVFRRSPFAYSPGYGWYGGTPSAAIVNGESFSHRGNGPIVVEAIGTIDTLHIWLEVAGRDSASYPRTAFYLHEAGDSSSRAVLVERGAAARFLVRRRASFWGLDFPSIELEDAFGESDPTASRQFVARSLRDSLILEATSGSWNSRTTLALTPLLGWSMIQNLAEAGSLSGHVSHILWIGLLIAPIGWWSTLSTRPRLALALSGGIAGIMALLVPALLGVASVSRMDLALMAAAIVTGRLLARSSTVRRTGGILP